MPIYKVGSELTLTSAEMDELANLRYLVNTKTQITHILENPAKFEKGTTYNFIK